MFRLTDVLVFYIAWDRSIIQIHDLGRIVLISFFHSHTVVLISPSTSYFNFYVHEPFCSGSTSDWRWAIGQSFPC
ncbi:unnamed protein product [Dicrocoelium dendriticum]|nr:unnamed protein product [Dicrocoelium dendriticum]